MAILGGLAFAIGIRWLVATAEVLEIHEQLKEGSKNKSQDENALTGAIVGAMASYREKTRHHQTHDDDQPNCRSLLPHSRNLHHSNRSYCRWHLWLIAGAIPNFAIAAAAFIIPHFFSKYQQVWDSRIKRNRKSRSTAAETVGGYLMQFKRTHYEIYWEILTYCKTPRSFTSIINRCNLNSKIGQVHLDFLKSRRFLAEVQDKGMTLLKATDAAKEYIALFNKTYRELFDDSPEFRI